MSRRTLTSNTQLVPQFGNKHVGLLVHLHHPRQTPTLHVAYNSFCTHIITADWSFQESMLWLGNARSQWDILSLNAALHTRGSSASHRLRPGRREILKYEIICVKWWRSRPTVNIHNVSGLYNYIDLSFMRKISPIWEREYLTFICLICYREKTFYLQHPLEQIPTAGAMVDFYSRALVWLCMLKLGRGALSHSFFLPKHCRCPRCCSSSPAPPISIRHVTLSPRADKHRQSSV